MKRNYLKYFFLCSVLWTSMPSFAFPFAYLSDYETTIDGAPLGWVAGDSIIGDVFTNDCLYCSDDSPAITGRIFMGCGQSTCDFIGSEVHYSAAVHTPPEYLYYVRQAAIMSGYYFSNGGAQGPRQYVVSIRGNAVRIWYTEEGVPFDSLSWHTMTVQLGGWAYLYFDGLVRVSGELSGGDLVIGSSRDIGITDNTIVAGTNLENGEIPSNSNSMLGFAAEGSIYIRNTWANGRANSEQGSDVVVTAVLIANSDAGGLRLHQPNDPEDTYICPCSPDLRGTFRLTGALVQRRRGSWFNDNNGGTGYRLVLKYDERLRTHGVIYHDFLGPAIEPDTIDFGEVVVGESRQEYLTLWGYSSFSFSSSWTTFPFSAPVDYQYTDSISIPITFTPPRAQYYAGHFSFYIDGQYHELPLFGTGVNPPAAQGVEVAVQPNPFNAVTTLSLNLPQAGDVNIILYDILGREAERLNYTMLSSGLQTIRLDMSQYASGVYFARLQTGAELKTIKLLLMK